MSGLDLLASQIEFPLITATSDMKPLMNGLSPISKTARWVIRHTIAVQQDRC